MQYLACCGEMRQEATARVLYSRQDGRHLLLPSLTLSVACALHPPAHRRHACMGSASTAGACWQASTNSPVPYAVGSCRHQQRFASKLLRKSLTLRWNWLCRRYLHLLEQGSCQQLGAGRAGERVGPRLPCPPFAGWPEMAMQHPWYCSGMPSAIIRMFLQVDLCPRQLLQLLCARAQRHHWFHHLNL